VETRKRILVADDDRITRRLLAVNLERWGYEVVLASDGLEAWEILRGEEPLHIVILDWCMPGMSGVDICRSMRAQAGRPFRYVLLISSRAQKQDLTEAFEAGADDYMTKPIHVRELESRLLTASRAVDKRRRARSGPEIQHTRRGEDIAEDATVTAVEAATPSDSALRGSVVGGKYKVVRPVASVMTYVRFSKQVPLVVVMNAPPFFVTGTPVSVTAPGNCTPTVYGGVPPKMKLVTLTPVEHRVLSGPVIVVLPCGSTVSTAPSIVICWMRNVPVTDWPDVRSVARMTPACVGVLAGTFSTTTASPLVSDTTVSVCTSGVAGSVIR
jgi:sigma-B regulation protein RsbU (phosphoserine phosphatase)